ncbi:hypothetical protein BME99_21235 [Pseudomonas protegens]|nr:hypothetical protein BME99_21235 [Pseudomonas protegens]
MGLQLPADYAWFLKECGGGYFALGTLYSLDSNSDFHLVEINRAHPAIAKDHLLFQKTAAVTSTGSGSRTGTAWRRSSSSTTAPGNGRPADTADS